MKNLFISVLTLVSIGASAQVALTNQGMTEYMIEQRLKYVEALYETSKYNVFIHMPMSTWNYEAGDELSEEYLILYPIK